MPRRSQTSTWPAPAAFSSRAMAFPAAPAPLMATRIFFISFPARVRALRRAASTTTAVPC